MLVIDLTTLGMLISNRQEGSAMSFIAWIVLGLVAGFIGSKLVNHSGEGLIRDVLLGVVGAFIGSYLFSLVWSVGRDWAESLQPARGCGRSRSVPGRLSHYFSPPPSFS